MPPSHRCSESLEPHFARSTSTKMPFCESVMDGTSRSFSSAGTKPRSIASTLPSFAGNWKKLDRNESPTAIAQRKAATERQLVPALRAMRTNRFVRYVALPSPHAVVNTHLAYRTERFVVKSRHTERRTQLFVELPKVLQMRRQRRNLQSIIAEQKLLVARVPQTRELALH